MTPNSYANQCSTILDSKTALLKNHKVFGSEFWLSPVSYLQRLTAIYSAPSATIAVVDPILKLRVLSLPALTNSKSRLAMLDASLAWVA